ncbi:hypothetical protein A152_0022215 [Vibrio tasmaniensis 1F-187]
MTVRSTVSADISMHVIWVNSTDSLILEQGNRGKGGEYQCV